MVLGVSPGHSPRSRYIAELFHAEMEVEGYFRSFCSAEKFSDIGLTLKFLLSQ